MFFKNLRKTMSLHLVVEEEQELHGSTFEDEKKSP